CTLARSPIRDPLSEGFRHFLSSMPAPVASGWSQSPGGPCTHWKAPPCHGAPPLAAVEGAGGVGAVRHRDVPRSQRDTDPLPGMALCRSSVGPEGLLSSLIPGSAPARHGLSPLSTAVDEGRGLGASRSR